VLRTAYYFTEEFNFPKGCIYNVDATSVSIVQNLGRILGPKGEKQVRVAISWERERNITAVCSVSASGNYIPPMLIYPGKRTSLQLQKNGTVGVSCTFSKIGKLLKHFSSSGFFILDNFPKLQRMSMC
jgi:hypothetical protein